MLHGTEEKARWEECEKAFLEEIDRELEQEASFVGSATLPDAEELLNKWSNLDSKDREAVSDALYELTEREREIIKLCYGIDHSRSHTTEEAAAAFGITNERVKQLRFKALTRLTAAPDKDDSVVKELHYKKELGAKGYTWDCYISMCKNIHATKSAYRNLISHKYFRAYLNSILAPISEEERVCPKKCVNDHQGVKSCLQ